MSKATIEQATNGYILTTTNDGEKERAVYSTLDAVMSALLAYFEYRYFDGTGKRYGRVVIHREEPACASAPAAAEKAAAWVASPEGQAAVQAGAATAEAISEAFREAQRVDPALLDRQVMR